jgi:hypothetical protein
MKSRPVRQVKYVTRLEATRNIHKISRTGGKRWLGKPRLGYTITLKWVEKKYYEGMGWSDGAYRILLAGSFKFGNQISGCLKGWKYLDQQSEY